MLRNGRTITDIKSKVDIFMNHYTRASRINTSRADPDLNRQFKKQHNAPSDNDESCTPFQKGELLSAMKKMKCEGAAGPGNTPTSFFKSFGLLALQELLSILNSSFSLAHCPRIWRVTTIIILLKAGKSTIKGAFFHPIRLTSCVVKFQERILANCLYYTLLFYKQHFYKQRQAKNGQKSRKY